MTGKLKFEERYNSWCHVLILLFITAASPTGAYAASMSKSQTITLFMAGDVMTGRGIDQVLSHPSPPVLYESWVKDAREHRQIRHRAVVKIAQAGFAKICLDLLP